MPKGSLVFIGGGDDSSLIFNKIFELAGGKSNSKIAIIPSAASSDGKSIDSYLKFFTSEMEFEKEKIWILPIQNGTENKAQEELAKKLEDYNIVFLVGGDQRDFINSLKKDNVETLLLKSIEKVYKDGGVIVGTSAGTNIMSTESIAGGTSEEALANHIAFNPSEDDGHKLLVMKGLDLIKDVVLDAHFEVKGRFGRLIRSAVLTNTRFGIGISERTAVIYKSDNTIEIIGFGDVLMTDIGNARILSKANDILHIREANVHLFTHGDKYNFTTGEFTPQENKKSISNIPYFDANDYHISLNVFKECETSTILVNYMLDNEAKDVIALVDYERNDTTEERSLFIRFEEKPSTNAFFAKLDIEGNQDFGNYYSGINVNLDIIPFNTNSDARNRRKHINAVLFGLGDQLQIVAYDNVGTLPICDAKFYIYDKDENLIYKRGTDRFGRALVKRVLKTDEEYSIKITWDFETLTKKFTFHNDMEGFCLS
ncbi:MAG: cyanophycinase [Bacteroidetes bacterium]|nr:cyanophycinase [Bacteroidota bacterium]